MYVERGKPFCASDDIIVVCLDVYLRRQQLAIAVRILVALASQNNGTVGRAVVGKRQGIGGIDLDGLSRIGFVGDEIKTRHPQRVTLDVEIEAVLSVIDKRRVLGVGGECQQREERKGEGLSCHSCVVFCI